MQQGLRVRGVATSQATADLAQRLAIPLTSLDEIEAIDITVDGADEVDPQMDLIKGWGGALVREKIVAAASKRLVILVGAEKLVPILGSAADCRSRSFPSVWACAAAGLPSWAWLRFRGRPAKNCSSPTTAITFSTVRYRGSRTQPSWKCLLRSIPGVVGTGLFLGMADTVLIQEGEQVQIRRREKS